MFDAPQAVPRIGEGFRAEFGADHLFAFPRFGEDGAPGVNNEAVPVSFGVGPASSRAVGGEDEATGLHCAGAAEDMGRALSLAAKVTVPFGMFEPCLETEDWSPLEPGVVEHKYYARGVGCVLQETVKGGHERMELIQRLAP